MLGTSYINKLPSAYGEDNVGWYTTYVALRGLLVNGVLPCISGEDVATIWWMPQC